MRVESSQCALFVSGAFQAVVAQHGVAAELTLAVMAAHHHGAFLVGADDKARRRAFLNVGDAVAVGAGEVADSFVGQAQVVLVHDLVVFDLVDGGVRGQNGQLLGLGGREGHIGDLDEILFAQSAGAQVEAHGKFGVAGEELEHAQDVDGLARGDVIDDGAVGDGLNHQLALGEFFLVFSGHIRSPCS